jgi:hypothetical protein
MRKVAWKARFKPKKFAFMTRPQGTGHAARRPAASASERRVPPRFYPGPPRTRQTASKLTIGLEQDHVSGVRGIRFATDGRYVPGRPRAVVGRCRAFDDEGRPLEQLRRPRHEHLERPYR